MGGVEQSSGCLGEGEGEGEGEGQARHKTTQFPESTLKANETEMAHAMSSSLIGCR